MGKTLEINKNNEVRIAKSLVSTRSETIKLDSMSTRSETIKLDSIFEEFNDDGSKAFVRVAFGDFQCTCCVYLGFNRTVKDLQSSIKEMLELRHQEFVSKNPLYKNIDFEAMDLNIFVFGGRLDSAGQVREELAKRFQCEDKDINSEISHMTCAHAFGQNVVYKPKPELNDILKIKNDVSAEKVNPIIQTIETTPEQKNISEKTPERALEIIPEKALNSIPEKAVDKASSTTNPKDTSFSNVTITISTALLSCVLKAAAQNMLF